jgi:glycosyltransferase involved in cell wall biosynthesis
MISIVMPLYNKADTVGRAINSVLAQTVSDWELIVIDDGSTDLSNAVVQQFDDPRIRLVEQSNAGVSAARNQGVAVALANVVALIDADDYWSPAHLANLGELITRFPDASLFATAYFMVGSAGQLRKVQVTQAGTDDDIHLMGDYFSCALQDAPPAHSSSVAVNRDVLARIGGFPVGVNSGEDLITWARLACVGKVAYSRRATGYYVVPFVSENRQEVIRRPPERDYVGDELTRLSQDTPQLGRSIRRYCANWFRIRAILFLELGERFNSLVELGKAIRASGVYWRDLAHISLLLLPAYVRGAVLSKWRQRHRNQSDGIQ